MEIVLVVGNTAITRTSARTPNLEGDRMMVGPTVMDSNGRRGGIGKDVTHSQGLVVWGRPDGHHRRDVREENNEDMVGMVMVEDDWTSTWLW